jgi:hypothetical protein
MNHAARFSSLFWAVALATGCGSAPPSKGLEPDSGFSGSIRSLDAGRERDVPRGTGSGMTVDGPKAEDAAAADARREAGRQTADAGDSDATVPAHACSAGHTCTGNARCERGCFGSLVYRCSCADGRFICTGCIAVDGGAPDVRSGPGLCATDVAEGHHCDPAGAVCQQRSDPQRLCACGDFGSDRIWICQ